MEPGNDSDDQIMLSGRRAKGKGRREALALEASDQSDVDCIVVCETGDSSSARGSMRRSWRRLSESGLSSSLRGGGCSQLRNGLKGSGAVPAGGCVVS